MIEVVRPGALSMVQDLGRPGFLASGVPRGGAADPWAARAANRLVGNPDDAALLEIALTGPTLRFHAATAIAVVAGGGEVEVFVDDVAIGTAKTHLVRQGSELTLSLGGSAPRAWVAFGGGLDLPLVLGSRSTELAGGFGGFEGRALRAGDRLRLGEAAGAAVVQRRLAPAWLRDLASPTLRMLPGPDSVSDAAASMDKPWSLSAVSWRVGSSSDRRGVRLRSTGEGVALARRGGGSAANSGELRSKGMLPGAVQLPPSGEPIILGVDAPVTGGYAWVGQVIEADVGRLAHLVAGAEIGFERVSFEAAERALAERQNELDAAVVSA